MINFFDIYKKSKKLHLKKNGEYILNRCNLSLFAMA